MAGKQRTALVSVAAATALVVLKLGTGLATGSLGLVSAGIESSGDVVAAVLTFFAIRLAGKPADQEHNFGHARAENLAALGEAAILAAGGTVVVIQAIERLTGGAHELDATPAVFVVIAIALAVDVSRTLVSVRTAREFGSAALRSNAFHFGADLAGTVAVLVGLALARAGHPRADALAALFVSLLIFGAAGRLVLENGRSLMDAAPPGAHEAVRAAIARLDPPIEVRRLRIRDAAGRLFVDVVVGVSAAVPLARGHAAADAVEEAVGEALPGSDVIVHVEPAPPSAQPVEQVLAVALGVPGVRETHNVSVVERDGRREVSLHVKVPGELTLEEGHEVTHRVEEAITAHVPDVASVRTHLEPLDAAVAGAAPTPAERRAFEDALAAAARTGVATRDARLLRVGDGLVGFVTLEVPGESTVAAAHGLASEFEEALRRELPALRDVVVHTEPSRRA
jgi:cation diffusion facilitator family transporter